MRQKWQIGIKFKRHVKIRSFSNAKQFTFAPHRVRKKISAQNQITRPIETKLEEFEECPKRLL